MLTHLPQFKAEAGSTVYIRLFPLLIFKQLKV